jgi:hypothetical protein
VTTPAARLGPPLMRTKLDAPAAARRSSAPGTPASSERVRYAVAARWRAAGSPNAGESCATATTTLIVSPPPVRASNASW